MRKELTFTAIITLDALCEIKLKDWPSCQCLSLGYTCLRCRTISARAELLALVDQIGSDMQVTKPKEAV